MDKQTQQVSEFMSLTGAEFAQAKYYLEAANWNLEQATNLFFENSGAQTTSTNQSSTNARNASTAMQDEDDDFIRSPIPQTAGRLFDDEDDYPMNPRFQPNIDQFEQQMRQQTQRSGPSGIFQSISNVFHRFTGGRAQRAQTPTQQNSLSGTQLGTLFQPPENILFSGSFDALKLEGQRQKKWLLVNIQNPSVFDSIRLNRDTFSNDVLQGIIQVYFLFWQVTMDSTQGQRFTSLYHVNTYPYIAILDPRTGENVKSWQGTFMNAEKLNDELQKFIDKNEHQMMDFDELLNTGSSTQGNVNSDYSVEPANEDDDEEEQFFQPMPTHSQQRPSQPQQQRERSTSGSRQVPIVVDEDDDMQQNALHQSDVDLTEDELMQQAIQASIEEAEKEKQREQLASKSQIPQSSQQQAPASSSQSAVSHSSQPTPQPVVEPEKPKQILNTPDMSINLSNYLITSPEQAQGKPTTRLRVKHADGKLETVTFLLDTPLAAIYALERNTLPEEDRKTKNIKVIFAGKALENSLEITLASAKLTNASLSAIVE